VKAVDLLSCGSRRRSIPRFATLMLAVMFEISFDGLLS
jgi:hypothetical protein